MGDRKKMIDENSVTIIIPTLCKTEEQKRSLLYCVESLLVTIKSKIIVAINGGETSIPVTPNEIVWVGSQGQCKAVNAAVATVNTEWLFVTNDDMVYAPNWFEKLTDGLEGEIQMCISPNLVEPQDGAPPFIKYFCGGAGGDFDKKKWLEFAKNHKDNFVESGFNLPFLIKKELWDLIGGYDINYDPWGSNGDSDLQAKIHLAGAKTWRNRNSIVYHFSQTSGTSAPENRPYWQKNWDYFIKKWGFPRQGDDHKVWYSKDLIDYEKLIYHPYWEGFYDKS